MSRPRLAVGIVVYSHFADQSSRDWPCNRGKRWVWAAGAARTRTLGLRPHPAPRAHRVSQEHPEVLLGMSLRDNQVGLTIPQAEVATLKLELGGKNFISELCKELQRSSPEEATGDQWLSLENFCHTASSRMTNHFEQGLNLFSKLCVGGNMFTREVWARLATSVRQLRHDQMEQGPTEPHAGHSTFLPSSGGAGGRVLLSGLWFGGGSGKNQFPYQTLVACLVWARGAGLGIGRSGRRLHRVRPRPL